jgi:hypothetical protein
LGRGFYMGCFIRLFGSLRPRSPLPGLARPRPGPVSAGEPARVANALAVPGPLPEAGVISKPFRPPGGPLPRPAWGGRAGAALRGGGTGEGLTEASRDR